MSHVPFVVLIELIASLLEAVCNCLALVKPWKQYQSCFHMSGFVLCKPPRSDSLQYNDCGTVTHCWSCTMAHHHLCSLCQAKRH